MVCHIQVWLHCAGFSHPYKEAKTLGNVLGLTLPAFESLPILTVSSGLLCPVIMSTTVKEHILILLPVVSPHLFISQHYSKINSAITMPPWSLKYALWYDTVPCFAFKQWPSQKKKKKILLILQKQFLPRRLMAISGRKRIIGFALVLCEKHYKLKISPMLYNFWIHLN